MGGRDGAAVEKDRTIVEAMRLVGEPLVVIEQYLRCLDLSESERDELTRLAKHAAEMVSGDVIEMNPLTGLLQRSDQRDSPA